MMKLLGLWNRRLDLTHDEAVRTWLDDHVPLVRDLLGPVARRYAVNIGLPADISGTWPGQAPPYDGVAELWLEAGGFDEVKELLVRHAPQAGPSERRFMGTVQRMICEPVVQKDLGRDHEGVKLMLLLTRHPDMTPRQCHEYWTGRHAPLVLEHFGDMIVRYETNLGVAGDYTGWAPDETPPYDGVAEFWMDATLEELQARIQERWPIVNPDERAFLGTYRAMIVEERVV